MKNLLSLFAALSISAFAAAAPRPQLLLPTQELQIPAGFHAWDVAIAGDWIAIGGSAEADDDPDVYIASERVYLYHRDASGTWSTGTLLVEQQSPQYAASVEMNDQILVVGLGTGTRIYEKTGTGWAQRALDANAASLVFPGIAIDGTRVALGTGNCGAKAVVLDRTTAGSWVQTGEIRGVPKPCDDTQVGNFHIELSGGAAILWDSLAGAGQHARMFTRNADASWSQTDLLEPTAGEPDYKFGNTLALRGALALVGGWDRGTHVYRRSGGDWAPAGFLYHLDWIGQIANGMRIGEQYIAYAGYNTTLDVNLVHVQRAAGQGFEEVAQLTTPDLTQILSEFDLSGSSVVAATWEKVFFYQLPASPGVRRAKQYDFETGTALTDWSIVPGGTFDVAQSGPSHVWRQSSTTGDAGAVLGEDLTAQAIQADLVPRAFNGSDRWVGLVTRYTDESNYYYVTLRNSGWISLRRKQNGVVTELARTPIGVSLDFPRRVRLVSAANYHAVYVDEYLYLKATDAALPHGRVGLRSYKASADFDNVLVSATTPIRYVQETLQDDAEAFDPVDGQWAIQYDDVYSENHYTQRSLAGDARSITWPVSEDQILETWLRVDQFAAGNGDPWVGVIARYQDPANYYYVTLRRSNQISLRKLVNGQITVLGTAPVDSAAIGGLGVRFDVVGQKLRVYVDGDLVLEAADATFASGKAGLATYKASAWFAGFTAYQP